MATIKDIAKRAHVAVSTVSYALNGKRPISQETRQRILAVMNELGYKPHALAQGLASKRSRILALVFPTIERGIGITELDFFTGAAEAARQNGYHLVLWSSCADDSADDSNELLELAQKRLVDGMILMEVHQNDERVKLLREIHFPFNMIGRCEQNGNIGYADIDFEQTVRDTLQYLAGLGHTNIGLINQSHEIFKAGYGPVVRTQIAFESLLSSQGLQGVARFCHATPQAGFETCRVLIDEHPELTALIVMNDRAVPGAMHAIADRGWSIPSDISLVSIVSSERMAEMMNPPLTTMDPPSTALARLAVKLLIEQLEDCQREITQILLPCRLVIRSSSDVCTRVMSRKVKEVSVVSSASSGEIEGSFS